MNANELKFIQTTGETIEIGIALTPERMDELGLVIVKEYRETPNGPELVSTSLGIGAAAET